MAYEMKGDKPTLVLITSYLQIMILQNPEKAIAAFNLFSGLKSPVSFFYYIFKWEQTKHIF
jgi:hypothetical protein